MYIKEGARTKAKRTDYATSSKMIREVKLCINERSNRFFARNENEKKSFLDYEGKRQDEEHCRWYDEMVRKLWFFNILYYFYIHFVMV